MHHSRLQGHPHIIGMREAYLTNDHLCVVVDYADGGDLAEHLSRHVYSTVRRCSSVEARFANICLRVVVSRAAAAVWCARTLWRYTELIHSWSRGCRTADSRRTPRAASSSSWCPHSTGCTALVQHLPAASLMILASCHIAEHIHTTTSDRGV